MPIRITLAEVLARKGLKAKQIGVSQTHLSKLCMALECEPGDLIQYDPDPGDLLAVDEE
ncbi:helix-turn-helix domain-containing protein [Corallococcus terminator]